MYRLQSGCGPVVDGAGPVVVTLPYCCTTVVRESWFSHRDHSTCWLFLLHDCHACRTASEGRFEVEAVLDQRTSFYMMAVVLTVGLCIQSRCGSKGQSWMKTGWSWNRVFRDIAAMYDANGMAVVRMFK